VLAERGFATVRVPDATVLTRLCAAGTGDALILDERFDTTTSTDAVLSALGADVSLPILALVRELPTARWLESLFSAGAWGTVTYPLGTTAWVLQLEVWVRASGRGRRLADDGLVDPATGLYNVRGLERRASEIDATARRTGADVACAVFAVDDGPLDDVSPRASHDTRADLRRRVAEACRRVGRASDVFGRIQGTEFALVAPGASAAAARDVVQRIQESLGDDASRVSVGVGVVPGDRRTMESVPDVLVRLSARSGRDRVRDPGSEKRPHTAV
jgi:diguanylate cyclase (GGDEF)-like protein